MKKFLLSLFSFATLANMCTAQIDDIGLFLGMAKYKGELSNSFFTPYMFYPAFGGYYRHNFNRHWAARMGIACTVLPISECPSGFSARTIRE